MYAEELGERAAAMSRFWWPIFWCSLVEMIGTTVALPLRDQVE